MRCHTPTLAAIFMLAEWILADGSDPVVTSSPNGGSLVRDVDRSLLDLEVSDFSVTETATETTVRLANNSSTASSSTIAAGGAGFGVAIDANRADVVSLRYHDVPSEAITVEFWYKVLDPHAYVHSIFAYSVYAHRQDGSTYEESNELSFMIGNHVLVLWGAGSRMRVGRETDPRVQEPCLDLQWHHYAFSWSMEKAEVRFYLDGEELDSGRFEVQMEDHNSTKSIDYTNRPFGFGALWDTALNPDAIPYGEHSFRVQSVNASQACNPETYHTTTTNNDTIALIEWSESHGLCSEQEQAGLALDAGAFAVVFFPANSSREADPQDLPQANHTNNVSQPVLWIAWSDAQSLLQHDGDNNTITFLRSRAGTASKTFRKPITQGGVLVLGQEPDKPWGDFDSLQAAAGVLDELRVWDGVRTPEEIAVHYKRSIGTSSVEASSLNLYWKFDDLYNATKTHDNNLLTTRDHSPSGLHTGLVGALPTIKNEMTYLDKPPRPPTRPDVLPLPSSPLVGDGDVVVSVVAGGFTVLELKSFHPDGKDPTTILESVPGVGALYSMEGDMELQIGAVVVGVNRTENKRIRFLAPHSFEGDATFQYSASDGKENVTATVRLIPQEILQPVSDATTILEDAIDYMALSRPSQLTQDNLQVIITELPQRGHLYQAQFPNPDSTYDEVEAGLPINQTGTIVANNRGVVLYEAELHDFSDPPDAAYASFRFRLYDQAAGVWSENATKTIVVTAQNDAPGSLDSNASTTSTQSIVLQLQSNDVDADYVDSFAARSFSRITEFPKGGHLYQFVDNATSDGKLENLNNQSSIAGHKGNLMDGTVSQVPMSFQWASNVVRFSSQYSPCGPACMTWKNPECDSNDVKGGGSTNGTCPETSWHSSNILGPPNFYPEYGDSRLLWEPNSQNAGNEFIELEFSYEMYINAIEIYETYKPGAVWKVSATSKYLDNTNAHCTVAGVDGVPECSQATNWELLWSKPREKVSPGTERATIFEPPLCQSTTKSKVIRIDLDTERVPGWNGYDAVKVTGTVDYPPGLVGDENNRVVFAPMDGVHGIDHLRFVTSDCIDTGKEGSYTIDIEAPQPGQFSTSFLDLIYMPIRAEPNEIIIHEVDLSSAMLKVEAILGAPLENASAMVWFTDALGVMPGTIFYNITSENSTFVLEVGSADYGMPLSHVEIWLYDPSSSSLTFRFKYAVVLFIECIHGKMDPESGKCLCKTRRWTGRDCSIETKENLNQVPWYIEAIAFGYFALLVAMCLVFGGLVYRNRNALIIKVSQPFFLYSLLGGSLFTSTAIPVRVATESDAACTITYWIFFVGFAVVYGSLLAKIWRTYQVFMSGMQMRRKLVTIQETLHIIAALVSMNVLVLSLWTALDPASWQRTVLVDDGDGYALSTVGECRSTTDSPYIIACFALNIGTMCLGAILCSRARKIPDKFNETYVVNFSTYIALNLCIIGIPVLILVQDDPSATLFVECSIVFLMVFAVLSCIFSNLIGWLYMENEQSMKRAIEDSVREVASGGRSIASSRPKADSIASMDSSHHSNYTRPTPKSVSVSMLSSASKAPSMTTNHSSLTSFRRSQLPRGESANISKQPSVRQSQQKQPSFTPRTVTETNCESEGNELEGKQGEEQPDDADKFLAAVQSLDEVERLLRKHPDQLEKASLRLLHERIGIVQTLAQKLSLATS